MKQKVVLENRLNASNESDDCVANRMNKRLFGSGLIFLALFFCYSCVGNQPRISDIQRDFTDVTFRFETYQQSQEEAKKRQQLALSQIREMVDQESGTIRKSQDDVGFKSVGESQDLRTSTVQSQPLSSVMEKSITSSDPTTVTDAVLPSLNQDAVKDLFQKAMGKYNRQQFASAAEDFILVYSNAKEDDLKAFSLYWAGESYYQNRQWNKAIQCFMRVESRFPNHRIVPAALLKEGYAYINGKNVSEGKAILKKLISTFPASGEAARACDRLRALGAL